MTSFFQYISEVLYLLGESRRKLPLLIILFLFLSFLNIAGLGLIGPYLALVVNSDLLTEGRFRDIIETIGMPLEQQPLLILLGFGLLGVFLLKAISGIFINRIIITYSLKQRVRLCSFLMQAFQQMPYTEHIKRNSSEYIHSLQYLTSVFAGVIQISLRIISEGLVAIAIIIILLLTNNLALGVLILLLSGILFGYDRLFRHKIQDCGKIINDATVQIVKAVSEAMDGFKEIRIFGKERYFQRMVNEGIQEVLRSSVKSQVVSTAPRFLMEFILVTFVVVLVVGAIFLNQNLQELVPTLGMFGVAAIRLLPSVNVISSGLLQLRVSRPSVSLLYDDLEKMQNIDTRSNRLLSKENNYTTFQNFSVENIYFRYPNTKDWTINNLNMSIKSGESIGLIGPSGSGKTTLVDILLGLLEPQRGKLLYNGHTLKSSLSAWHNNLAYLPQDIFVIDETLRRNVALGDDDTEINEKRLYKALSQAHLAELVDELPEGVNTLLGERGVRLSGGQRQRVALARAFYHERDILVMDEATSSLDHETEREIVKEIKRLKGKKTLIVIAHRFTTVQYCDCIYRLEKGQIIDSGSPQKMLNLEVETNA